MKHQRAILDEEKTERRQEIVNAALNLFENSAGHLASVAKVAQKAGLAKGTVYLYFRTKEEIFLSLLADEFDQWFASMNAMLIDKTTTVTIETTVERLCQFVIERPDFLRLASLSNSILEQNIDRDAALTFKGNLAGQLVATGQMLEDRLPILPPNYGPLMLVRSYALIIGLWQMTEPPAAIRDLIDTDDRLAIFRQQFANEIRPALLALWHGSLTNEK